jgi:hypothetical protein
VKLRTERQLNPVADEVLAVTAVVRPILQGVLYALKKDVVDQAGGYDDLKLKMLGRLHRPGDGDIGICFEYAVHDALQRGDATVLERVSDAMGVCRVPGDEPSSLLFGAEKTGLVQLIQALRSTLTTDSVLMYGTRGRPVKLRRHVFRVQLLSAVPTPARSFHKVSKVSGRRTCSWATSIRIDGSVRPSRRTRTHLSQREGFESESCPHGKVSATR